METQKWSFKITPVRIFMFLIVGFTLLLALYRLIVGLGFSTNLNDRWPWGLWIGFDLTAVALAGAGYSICVLSHIFNIKRFAVYARRGMLISLLGYIYVLLTLILEVGRWDNAWRPLVSWGHHSPLFEVFIAIAIYMVIQFIEFFEVVTEKIFKSWHKYIKLIMPIVFIVGGLIPFGHQASLGAIYLPMINRLHPLWWSPMLPWFFLITSFYVGPVMVTLDTLWSSRVYNHSLDTKSLQSLIRVSGVLMLVYLILKVFDLSRLNALNYIFSGTFQSNMFLIEMIVGVIIPVIICFTSWSSKKIGLTIFSLCTIFGVILSRINVVFTGMYKALGPGYTPSWIEWGISIGLLLAIVLAYMYIVENFNIYKHSEDKYYSKNNMVSNLSV